MKPCNYKISFVVSFIISVLILVISAAGLTDDLYARESHSWQIQCVGQDLINLVLITPCLMLSALLLLKQRLIGELTWPGVMLYVIYTFAIYCFDIHFNSFFIEYCAVFGLSIYSFVHFVYRSNPEETSNFHFSTKLVKIIAVYLLVLGITFYSLWLSEIVLAARSGNLPKNLITVHLPTNPVHVLDLSVVLPLLLITSFLLFRKKRFGLRLAAYMLTFSFLMNLTILVLNMLQEDNLLLRFVFIILSLVSFTLLVLLMSQYRSLNENRHDLLSRKSE